MHASTHLPRRSLAKTRHTRQSLLRRLATPEVRFAAQLLGWAIVAALPIIMLVALGQRAEPSAGRVGMPTEVPGRN